MISEFEMGLAEADERIAEAESNIRQIGSLIPELVKNGYTTVEVEGQVEQMMQALDQLHAQRQSIIENLDGTQAPPRIIQKTVISRSWREICMRVDA
jgi:hypothetical protein